MTRAKSFEALVAAVLPTLTERPQHVIEIARAAKVTTYEASIVLSHLANRGQAIRASKARATFTKPGLLPDRVHK